MDVFIEQSNALLEARPDTTRVSTRFTHKKVKESGERVVAGAKPAVAIIKTYDPVSGILYKYRLTRVNELSRILSSLGPHHVDLGASRKRGLASLMSDVELPDSAMDVDGQTEASAAATAGSVAGKSKASKASASESASKASSKSSSKKKRGKK